MNVFNSINEKIQQVISGEATGEHAGYYMYKDFDEEDKKELKSWEALGETLYVKVVNNIEFTLDVLIS